MADLQAQLQATLGSSYTLERELGGGGMSRVYLAAEIALGRKVVVKVLPPEMAAGVNVDRFRREIQLAAQLQHPHIVPLHAAGQAGDIFYYTMPLVEGESLRAKLAREGELPIGETVRILRDVAEALAYAHAHGVVHRDIKPDNVLISGHHAVVTDFGVAKAVSAASGGSSLTSLGVALGTPAYMAPEQAAADPHVDHRADLYAVGAMAYEMLCGRPPFTGMAPQQVLAAQVSLTPDPCIAHRSAVPPALNALVMRLLAKKPADRIQRADELAAMLEAMSTPSGGMAPTGAVAAVSSGTQQALRRAHPARVIVTFAAAAVLVLAVVYVLMLRLGLPGWVFAAAVVLMAVGLPIILLTGRAERQRALARTTGLMAPATPMQHWFTWRRALTGGAVAFGALALAAAVYTAMRLLGIGPVGTLVASGALHERQRVILAQFADHAADSTLGATLTEAFRVDLSQSPTVTLVDGGTIAQALRRMKEPAGVVLTPAVAREVAQREGVSALVTGQIDPVGKGYVLSASVVSPGNGAVLTAVRETADNDAGLIPALDRLSRSLRERIGESLVTIRAGAPLEQVTTASLEALRDYTEGMRLSDAGHEQQAIPLMHQAIALDTGFAMAYRKLGVLLMNTAGPDSERIAAFTHAFADRTHLPEIERDQTEAEYYDQVDYDPVKEAAAFRAVLQLAPNDPIAVNDLALLLSKERDYAAAESLLTRGVAASDAVSTEYEILAAVLEAEGRRAAADSVIGRFSRAFSDDPVVPLLRALLLASRFEYDSAAQIARQARRGAIGPGFLGDPNFVLALVAESQGRLTTADRDYANAMRTAEQLRSTDGYFGAAVQRSLVDLRFRNRPAAALARIDSALARHPLATLPAVARPYSLLAELYAEAGRADAARQLMAEYRRTVPPGIRRADFEREAAAGAIDMAAGQTDAAIADYRKYRDESGCATCGYFQIASAFQRSGQSDSARIYFERELAAPGALRLLDDASTIAATYQRLGELYEAKGDRAKAAAYYGKLLDLWKNADPELQPIVRDVRARVAALAGPG